MSYYSEILRSDALVNVIKGLPNFNSSREAAQFLDEGFMFICENELRRVAFEAGIHNTRGDFGSPIWAETACLWEEGEYRPFSVDADCMFVNLIVWKVWDGDYGWL